MKIAVLGWHLIKNHPLPDGNKRVGLVCMIEMAERNGRRWRADPRDEDTDGEATAALIEKVAAGEVSVEELTDWVRQRLA